jgi:hypothetical protein
MARLRTKRIVGGLLLATSLTGIIQSVREERMWDDGRKRHEEEEEGVHALPITFNGHLISVRDDQPFDSARSEAAVEGRAQWLLDGVPLGEMALTMVRPGRGNDMGRYHLWMDVGMFRDRRTDRWTLWLTRRLASAEDAAPTFEVIQIPDSGALAIDTLRSWQLGSSYPLFRSTQFIREGTWGPFPLSTLDFALAPILWLIFPLGTLLLGLRLLWKRRPA